MSFDNYRASAAARAANYQTVLGKRPLLERLSEADGNFKARCRLELASVVAIRFRGSIAVYAGGAWQRLDVVSLATSMLQEHPSYPFRGSPEERERAISCAMGVIKVSDVPSVASLDLRVCAYSASLVLSITPGALSIVWEDRAQLAADDLSSRLEVITFRWTSPLPAAITDWALKWGVTCKRMFYKPDQYWQVQAQLGAAYFSDTTPQYIIYVVGDTGCGKNGVVDAIRMSAAVPGMHKLTMAEVEAADKDGSVTSLSGIEGASVVWVDEVLPKNTGAMHEGHTLLSLATGEDIKVRVLYAMPRLTPSNAQVLMTSTLPVRIDRLRTGMSRRVMTIGVNRGMGAGENIERFGEKIAENAPWAVMQWLAEGAANALANPQLLGRPISSWYEFFPTHRAPAVQNNIEWTADLNDQLTLPQLVRAMGQSYAVDGPRLAEMGRYSNFKRWDETSRDWAYRGYRLKT